MSMKTALLFAGLATLIGSGWLASQERNPPPPGDFAAFVSAFQAKVVPLYKDAALASFTASVSGKDEDYARAADLQIKLQKVYSNKEDFSRLKAWKASGTVTDPLQMRELDVIYLGFLPNQLDEKRLEEMVRLQSEIEKKFNTFRAVVDGRPMSDNELEEVLRDSTDSAQLEKCWKASKEIGRSVSPDIIKLVKLRNAAAKELGFASFHDMQLVAGEQDPAEISRLFDELDRLSRDGFVRAKDEIDTYLAARCKITKDQMAPWHYQNRFFQEAPRIYAVDFDSYYGDRDLVALTKAYYTGVGLPVDDIIARSDLFEKPGKYQHAFCTDVDRQGDVRVISSIKPNQYWMNTLLHECGHGVYSKYNDPSLPWVLRDAAHAFTTEAIANMFGRFASSPSWLQEMTIIDAAEREKIADASANSLRLEQVVFSRWAQVMYRFEKGMYENPDRDLNALWWELVEKYQMMKKPAGRNEPDWATKIHVAAYPAYYHNYLLGELLASQLYNYICSKVVASPESPSFVGQPEVGAFLSEKVFKPGMRYHWNEMIEKATGERLTPTHYARQFFGAK